MISGSPVTDPHAALAGIEEELQDYLLLRPPPFFVQRRLALHNVPKEERRDFLQRVFPSVDNPDFFSYGSLADGLACTQRDDVACLNRFFYADLQQKLEAAVIDARTVLEDARNRSDEFLLYRCAELLGYLLAERCWWEFITQPLVKLHLDEKMMSEAASLLEFASEHAKKRRDWLLRHRIAANQARLGYLARREASELARVFDTAISLGQLCLDGGFPTDRAFQLRRDDLLHMAGAVKFAGKDLTYLNLCAHIKSPPRIKPSPGMVRLTLEEGALIGNISPPLAIAMDETIRRLNPHTAFIDILSLEEGIRILINFRGSYHTVNLGYRQLHQLENLDLLFRPSRFQVMLSPGSEPLTALRQADADGGEKNKEGKEKGEEENPGDRTVFAGRDFLHGKGILESEVVEGMKWVLRFPAVEVGTDETGKPYRTEFGQDLAGMHWERSLGTMLDHILPPAEMKEGPEHLVIAADGPLALLPFHLALLPDNRLLADRYRISYAPSLHFFSPTPQQPEGTGSPRIGVVLNSANRLQGPIWELKRLQSRFGRENVPALDGFEGSREALQEFLAGCDVLHIATHGHTFTDTPEQSGIELSRNRILTISAIERLTLKPGSLVFLNACGSNRVTIESRIRFSSIANAFLAAGAATVIATFWETDDVAAALVSDRFYVHLLQEGRGRLESLDMALDRLRALDTDQLPESELGSLALFLPLRRERPYRNPSYWGQFALFGHW